jgi:hypothetical protein
MIQQFFGLIIVIYFLVKLIWQKKNKQIPNNEFLLWLIFWMIAGLSILFIKWIDRLVAGLGFSGSGIEILLYLGIAVLFYFIFRLRLRLEKIEKDITKITRAITFLDKK